MIVTAQHAAVSVGDFTGKLVGLASKPDPSSGENVGEVVGRVVGEVLGFFEGLLVVTGLIVGFRGMETQSIEN